MHLRYNDIEKMDTIRRLNLINSVVGIKPAVLVGTRSETGMPNLAIFSSVIHLGSNPALLGFVLRPKYEVRRHTYENIKETGVYTINHIHPSFIEKAHYTSAKFDKEISEFEACKLTDVYYDNFQAPYVQESNIKIGMKFEKEFPIDLNNTSLIVGRIQHIYLLDSALDENGDLLPEVFDPVGVSGLNHYFSHSKLASLPYARPNEIPDFSRNKI